jgi:hypothetical protein
MSLTGRFRFRKTILGKAILQLEEERPVQWPFSNRKVRTLWHDARYPELLRPEIRGLVNLMDYVDGHPRANLAILAAVHPARESGDERGAQRQYQRVDPAGPVRAA